MRRTAGSRLPRLPSCWYVPYARALKGGWRRVEGRKGHFHSDLCLREISFDAVHFFPVCANPRRKGLERQAGPPPPACPKRRGEEGGSGLPLPP